MGIGELGRGLIGARFLSGLSGVSGKEDTGAGTPYGNSKCCQRMAWGPLVIQ